MTQNKHVDKIMQSYKDGRLNEYMYNRLMKVMESGVPEDLANEVVEDAQYACDHGVNSDRDYNVYFYIGHLTDDILDDTFGIKLDDIHKKDLKRYLFSHKDDETYKLNNLVDYRLLIHKWLCDRLSKKAYPNTMGKSNRDPICDLDRWISTLKNIYSVVHDKKGSHGDALDYFTSQWDVDEKQKFINWMRYYEGGNTEKYNVKNAKLTKEADLSDGFTFPSSWARQDDRGETAPSMSTYKIRKEKTKREQDEENAKLLKIKMRSRLDSLKKLVSRFNDILPQANVSKIYEEIHRLDMDINSLKAFASMQDCIIRSANRIRKFGLIEGAELLEKTAAEPAVGTDVLKSMPQGISDQPNLPPSQTSTFNIKTTIDRLEGLSKTLKSRDMIRELASIDILLNELGLASYFPELTDAQAHLIEAFGYASNKVESIIAKLRGSGPSKPKPPEAKPPVATPLKAEPVAPPQKPMDTGEIMNKPVGEVKTELPAAPVAPKKPE